MTRSEAIDKWVAARADDSCYCHIDPPCGFCLKGYSLSLTEYLNFYEKEISDGGKKGQSSPESDYDRAMRGI
jgi:hypothetical protein